MGKRRKWGKVGKVGKLNGGNGTVRERSRLEWKNGKSERNAKATNLEKWIGWTKIVK